MRRPERGGAARVLSRPAPGAPPAPRVPEPDRFTLDNGLRVVAAPWGALPQVALRLVLPVGASADPAGLAGLAGLVGRTVPEGAGSRSADELNARLDLLGASLDVSVDHDFTEIDMVLLRETLDEGVALLADVVMRPRFPAHELDRARDEVLDAIEARADEPANVADDAASRAVFGPTHPYGRPAIGTRDDVSRVERAAVERFHAAHYRPAGAFLVAAGALDPERFAATVAESFGSWAGERSRVELPGPPSRAARAGDRIVIPWPDSRQSEIRVAGTGLQRASDDWIPAAVTNYLLGGSTITGRLGANLREKRGWTYGARSAFSAGVQPGGWMADTAVDVEVRDAAVREIMREIRRMSEEEVPEAELRRAQDALVLSLPRAFETPDRVLTRFTTIECFGLSRSYWRDFPAAVHAVDVATVQRMARRYLAAEDVVRVCVG
jgi:zinc protease